MNFFNVPTSFCLIIIIIFSSSCATENQLIYLKNIDDFNTLSKINYEEINEKIQVGDILKIDVQTLIPEAAVPYNESSQNNASQNLSFLQLEGYLVSNKMQINFPVLGNINVSELSESQLERKLSKLLEEGGHLTNPSVRVRRVNLKFTVLGEVNSPGTFSYFDKKLNLFQALGYAGDLTIDGKRKDIRLIREENGVRNVYKLKLTNIDILKNPAYYIKNNDVIIVNPSFSRIKSAGFIGSISSISTIATLLISLTIIVTNN